MNFKRAPLRLLAALKLAGIAGLFLQSGCATGPGRAQRIDALHVFSAPMALDLDGVSGPDAFGLTLYASAADTPKGLRIGSGRIEIQMFDGALTSGSNTQAIPARVWTFSSAELKTQAVKTSLGTGYRFVLRWNEAVPRQERISLVVRYVPPSGTVIPSAPTTIALSAGSPPKSATPPSPPPP